MSKNNYQEIMRRMAKQHQRFSLRKLSVGVASVLLGTTFIFGSGVVAHADEITVDAAKTTKTQQISTSVTSSSNQSGALTSSQPSSTASVAENKTTSVVDEQNNMKSNTTTTDVAKSVTTSRSAVSNPTVNKNQLTGNEQQVAPVVLSEKPTDSPAPANEQTQTVKVPFKVQYETQSGTYQTITKDFTFELTKNDSGKWRVPDDVDTNFKAFKRNLISDYWSQGYTYGESGADSLGIGWPHNFLSAKDIQTIKNNKGNFPADWLRPDNGGSFSIKFEGRTVEIVMPARKDLPYLKNDDHFVAAGVKKGDPVPGTRAHFLKDIPVSDVQLDCTRTINLHYWDGHTETKKQVKSLGLSNVNYNLITGELTGLDSAWPDFEQWDEYDLPENTYNMHQVNYLYPNRVDSEDSLDAKSFNPNKPAERNVTVDFYVGQPAHYIFKYVNEVTGEKLTPLVNNGEGDRNAYLDPSWRGQKLADYIGTGDLDSDGQPSTNDRPAYAINGYKLLNYDQFAQEEIDGQDHTITFEYAPLSPVVTNYVDEKTGKIIYQGYIDNVKNNALPGQHYTTEKIDIPGYQFDYASANTDGLVGQYQKKGDENPITVTYYYKVIPGQEKIAQYSVDGPRDFDQPERSFVPPMQSGDLKEPFDYQGWGINTTYRKFLKDNNYVPLGGENIVGGYFTPYINQINFEYRRKQPVMVNYLKAVIKNGKIVDTTTKVAEPTKIIVSADKTWRNWQAIDKNVKGYSYNHVELGEMPLDGTVSSGTSDFRIKGSFALLPQQVNFYYLETAEPQVEEKTITRVVCYVENNEDGQALKKPVTQKVTLAGTYYVHDGRRVNATSLVKNGKTIYVVSQSTTPTETWAIKTGSLSHDVTTNTANNQQFDFNPVTGKIEAPNELNDPNGKAENTWYHTSTKNNTKQTIDPNNLTFDKDGNATLDPVYLIYRQKGQYSIHYIDENTGKELTTHEVKNVGKDKFIGDTPDVTKQLWTTYTDDGYVLDKVSDNAKNGKLGQQELTKGVNDQYVYLKHGKTVSTAKTKKDDQKSTTTLVSRKIYYRDAETGKKITITDDHGHEIAPTITQTVNYVRVPVYDSVDGSFLGFAELFTDPNTGLAQLGSDNKPQVKKNGNDAPILMPKDSNGWVPTGSKEYPSQDSPDLSKYGYKKTQSLKQKVNKGNGTKVDSHAADPTKNGSDVNVYYFHDTTITDKPKPGVKHEILSKAFTRTVVYKGVKNGQTHDVNGSPVGTAKYQQKITFTRKATIDKVNNKVIGYTDWEPEGDQLSSIDSKRPSEIGYDTVDINQVPAQTVDPKSDQTDLGTVTVTYRMGHQVGTITYIDDVTGKTLGNVDKTSGEHGEPIQFNVDEHHRLNNYLSKGYELVSNNFKGNETFNKDNKKNNFVVHLTHGIATDSLTKTVTRTITYVDRDIGAAVNGAPDGNSSYKQTATFTLTEVKDKVTGDSKGYNTDGSNKVVYENVDTAWQHVPSQTFNEVTSRTPEEVNYDHYDTPKIAKETVKATSTPANKVVKYWNNRTTTTTRTVTETIHYVYKDGRKAHDDYIAVPKKFTHTVVTDGDKVVSDTWTLAQTFGKVTSPEIPGYMPDYGQIDSKTVDHDGGNIELTVTYTPTPKTYNTGVKYVDETGNELIPSVDGQKGLKTGYIFDNSGAEKKTITTTDGTHYKLVKSENVNGTITDHNETTTYVYEKVTQPTNPTTPTSPTQPTEPTNPTTPTSPTQPTEPTTPTSPTQPTEPTTPTSPTQPTEPTTPTSPTQPTEPTTPTKPGQPVLTPVQPTTAKLPQTGNESHRGLIALGFAGLISLLGLGKRDRRHD